MPVERLQDECSHRVDVLLNKQGCPLSAPEKQQLVREVMDEIFGLGPIEELMRDLAKDYTIVIVTHNMQQAARVSDMAAFLMMMEDRSGALVEYGRTSKIFTNPKDKRTEDYITGRFG